MARRIWTREELILALRLYMQIPFGRIHSHNPSVIELSNAIGRSPSSIALRLTNFAACDPYHRSRGVKGMDGGLRICQPIWNEFADNTEELVYQSDMIMETLITPDPVDERYPSPPLIPEHTEGIASVKIRLAQNAFRSDILRNYDHTCAITGIDIDELLIASHIVPWAVSSRHRLNPENGILLSALFDRAFDQGLIAINTDYTVLLAPKLKQQEHKQYYYMFKDIQGLRIKLPENYPPAREFLEFHMDEIFLH